MPAAYGRMFDYVGTCATPSRTPSPTTCPARSTWPRARTGSTTPWWTSGGPTSWPPRPRRCAPPTWRSPGPRAAAALDQARAGLRAPDADRRPRPARRGGVGGGVLRSRAGAGSWTKCRLNLLAVNRLYTLAFPIYRDFGPAQPPVYVIPPAAGRPCATTTVVDTRALAVKSLQERMPGILTRGLLGAVAKGEVQQKAEKNYGPLGGLLSKVASAVVTSADRRSWLSLPAEVQVASAAFTPGPSPARTDTVRAGRAGGPGRRPRAAHLPAGARLPRLPAHRRPNLCAGGGSRGGSRRPARQSRRHSRRARSGPVPRLHFLEESNHAEATLALRPSAALGLGSAAPGPSPPTATPRPPRP